MVSTLTSEPRYPPWLRRALSKKAESDRVWALADSKRSKDDNQVPAQVSSATTAAEGEPDSTTAWMSYVLEAAARDDVTRVRAYVDEDKQRMFARRDFLRSGGGGESLLHVATTHGSVEVVRYLVAFLESNFSHEIQRQVVNAIDTQYSKTTPLIAVCRSSGGAALNRLEILKLLVRCGANTTATDAHGDNVLHWCTRNARAALLRYFLKEIDAGAGAVFARNNKRETPLDIAQRQLNHKRTLAASTVYNLLLNVDHECNLRLKMQLICRGQVWLSSQAMAHDSDQLRRCLESSELLTQRSSSVWAEALAQAEKRRQRAEEDDATTASERARSQALEWLESKEGKEYLKKQAPVATTEVKQQIQNGTIAKPKDIKKAAAQYTAESYAQRQVQSARHGAIDAFRAKRPPYSSEGATSIAALAKLLGL